MEIKIEASNLQSILKVLKQIPEFERLQSQEFYLNKVGNKESLMLIATIDNQVVGCKAGYDKYKDGSFYSWLGAVIPEYRKRGIAKMLADHQEEWAKRMGYNSIRFKTKNRHKSMLHFALGNGFSIFNVQPKEELGRFRIELIKQL